MKSPVSKLGPKFFWMWLLFALGGPLLTCVEIEFVSKLGIVLMCMSFGFVLFGLGLEVKTITEAEKAG